jgi:hypothetical protein
VTRPRQRHIPLNIDERLGLDQRKRDYEDRTGDVGDWGKFLGTVSLAGLAALGVYEMAQAIKRAPTVWQVDCSGCGVGFPIQVPNPPPWRLALVKCPGCGAELVIDFVKSASVVSNEHGSGSDGLRIAFCHVCQQPVRATFSGINPQAVEYLVCERCGRVPGIRSWE